MAEKKKQSRWALIRELLGKGLERSAVIKKVHEKFPSQSVKRIGAAVSVCKYDLDHPEYRQQRRAKQKKSSKNK